MPTLKSVEREITSMPASALRDSKVPPRSRAGTGDPGARARKEDIFRTNTGLGPSERLHTAMTGGPEHLPSAMRPPLAIPRPIASALYPSYFRGPVPRPAPATARSPRRSPRIARTTCVPRSQPRSKRPQPGRLSDVQPDPAGPSWLCPAGPAPRNPESWPGPISGGRAAEPGDGHASACLPRSRAKGLGGGAQAGHHRGHRCDRPGRRRHDLRHRPAHSQRRRPRGHRRAASSATRPSAPS